MSSMAEEPATVQGQWPGQETSTSNEHPNFAVYQRQRHKSHLKSSMLRLLKSLGARKLAAKFGRRATTTTASGLPANSENANNQRQQCYSITGRVDLSNCASRANRGSDKNNRQRTVDEEENADELADRRNIVFERFASCMQLDDQRLDRTKYSNEDNDYDNRIDDNERSTSRLRRLQRSLGKSLAKRLPQRIVEWLRKIKLGGNQRRQYTNRVTTTDLNDIRLCQEQQQFYSHRQQQRLRHRPKLQQCELDNFSDGFNVNFSLSERLPCQNLSRLSSLTTTATTTTNNSASAKHQTSQVHLEARDFGDGDGNLAAGATRPPAPARSPSQQSGGSPRGSNGRHAQLNGSQQQQQQQQQNHANRATRLSVDMVSAASSANKSSSHSNSTRRHQNSNLNESFKRQRQWRQPRLSLDINANANVCVNKLSVDDCSELQAAIDDTNVGQFACDYRSQSESNEMQRGGGRGLPRSRVINFAEIMQEPDGDHATGRSRECGLGRSNDNTVSVSSPSMENSRNLNSSDDCCLNSSSSMSSLNNNNNDNHRRNDNKHNSNYYYNDDDSDYNDMDDMENNSEQFGMHSELGVYDYPSQEESLQGAQTTKSKHRLLTSMSYTSNLNQFAPALTGNVQVAENNVSNFDKVKASLAAMPRKTKTNQKRPVIQQSGSIKSNMSTTVARLLEHINHNQLFACPEQQSQFHETLDGDAVDCGYHTRQSHSHSHYKSQSNFLNESQTFDETIDNDATRADDARVPTSRSSHFDGTAAASMQKRLSLQYNPSTVVPSNQRQLSYANDTQNWLNDSYSYSRASRSHHSHLSHHSANLAAGRTREPPPPSYEAHCSQDYSNFVRYGNSRKHRDDQCKSHRNSLTYATTATTMQFQHSSRQPTISDITNWRMFSTGLSSFECREKISRPKRFKLTSLSSTQGSSFESYNTVGECRQQQQHPAAGVVQPPIVKIIQPPPASSSSSNKPPQRPCDFECDEAIRAKPTEQQPQNQQQRVIIQGTTTELLNCLCEFLYRKCRKLELFRPSVAMSWLREADQTLLSQGWQEITFINPANVVFLYMLLRDLVSADIESEAELELIVMSALYLAYSYMGNEISYPLQPFLCKQDRHERFWDRTLYIIELMSGLMLKLNADAAFFAEVFSELKGCNSLVLDNRSSESTTSSILLRSIARSKSLASATAAMQVEAEAVPNSTTINHNNNNNNHIYSNDTIKDSPLMPALINYKPTFERSCAKFDNSEQFAKLNDHDPHYDHTDHNHRQSFKYKCNGRQLKKHRQDLEIPQFRAKSGHQTALTDSTNRL